MVDWVYFEQATFTANLSRITTVTVPLKPDRIRIGMEAAIDQTRIAQGGAIEANQIGTTSAITVVIGRASLHIQKPPLLEPKRASA